MCVLCECEVASLLLLLLLGVESAYMKRKLYSAEYLNGDASLLVSVCHVHHQVKHALGVACVQLYHITHSTHVYTYTRDAISS